MRVKRIRAFLLVSLIVSAVCCIILIGIPGVIFANIGRKKVTEVDKPSDLIGMAICNMIFGSVFGLVGGILMLCLKPQDLAEYKQLVAKEAKPSK